MATNGAIAETEVLSSWKEIASYLGRGVRTAQRWEAELQMPVYRPWGKDHSAVVAMKSEIDLWIRSRSRERRTQQLAGARATIGHNSVHRELVANARALRADVARNRVMLHLSLAKLIGTLEGLVKATTGEAVSDSAELDQGSLSI